MIYEKPHNDGRGVTGPGTSFGEVFSAAVDQAWYVDNPLARRAAMEEAYDRRIEAVFGATGQRLPNPARLPQAGLPDIEDIHQDFETSRLSRQQKFRRNDPYEDFDRQLADLERQHPDHAEKINARRSPREDARERARKAEHGLEDVLQRYDGFTGGSTIAALAGGMRGALSDPANLLGMAVGPMGTVGNGFRALAWSALKTGAANAAVETSFQPLIAGWRQEAGLEYGVSQLAANVGGAFALGGALDMGGRAVIRGVQRARGRAAHLDEGGGITGWGTPDEVRLQAAADELDRAARKSANADVRAAATGNPAAMRRLADELGLGDDVKAAIDRHEVELATSPRHADLDPHESDAQFMQAVRHVLDPEREPPPGMIEPRRRAEMEDGNGQQATGNTAEPPSRQAARQMLEEGTGTPIEAAVALREHPELAGAVSLASNHMQVASALARLSDEAFGAVVDGGVDAQHGALVGQLVPDRTRHASILNALDQAAPESLQSARQMIAALILPANGRHQAFRPAGLDDPSGPEAQKQIDALEDMLSSRIDAAYARDGSDTLDVALRDGLDRSDRLTTLKELIEGCKL